MPNETIIGLGILAVLVVGIVWFIQQGAEDWAVRRVLDEVRTAALGGLNSHNAGALDDYLATVAEGAQAAGLAETQQA